jgi:hypothetical protein
MIVSSLEAIPKGGQTERLLERVTCWLIQKVDESHLYQATHLPLLGWSPFGLHRATGYSLTQLDDEPIEVSYQKVAPHALGLRRSRSNRGDG